MKRKFDYFPYLLLAPGIIIVLGTVVYPIIRSFIISLHRWNLTESKSLQSFIGLKNYIDAITSPSFWEILKRTFIFTGSIVILVILISLGVSLILSKERKAYSLLRGLLITPFAVSTALLGFSWRFMLNPEYGLFDKIIEVIIPPLADVVWLSNPVTAMIAVMSVIIWIWVPFVSLSFISSLMGFPDELYEAARIDGASSFQIFYHVTLPLLRPMIFIQATIVTMWVFRAFPSIATMTGGGPSNATRILNYHVYEVAFNFFEMGRGAALAWMLASLTFLFSIFYFKMMTRSER